MRRRRGRLAPGIARRRRRRRRRPIRLRRSGPMGRRDSSLIAAPEPREAPPEKSSRQRLYRKRSAEKQWQGPVARLSVRAT